MITFETTECNRCNGEGIIDLYRHIDGGLCAKCNGSGQALSRRGASAQQAYKKAISERCGKWGFELTVGDTLQNAALDNQPIENLEERDGVLWAQVTREHGTTRVGISPRRRYILHMPQAADEIARDIAARAAGATYR